MNRFLIAWVLFPSTLAFAFAPQLGHYATYFRVHGNIQYATKERIDGVSGDSYVVGRYNIQTDGSERLVRSSSEQKNILDKKFISDIRARCRELRGSLQTITVRAGTFNACKVVTEEASFHAEDWYAQDVPFGVVKHLDFLKANPSDIASFDLVQAGIQP